MSDMVEGIGGAIEGTLAGRAIEPGRGEAQGDGFDQANCSNCGASVVGAYCSQCGQKLHVHRTLSAIAHDLVHGVLHLDGKFWNTIPLLAFKPGTLTRRYIDGERAKFVSPMAMFLFSVFAMFAVFQMVGLSVPADLDTDLAETMREQGEAELERARARVEAMPANDPERAEAEQTIASIEAGLAEFDKSGTIPIGEAGSATLDTSGVPFIDSLIKKWTANPSLMLYKLQANGYKFSWLLIPLSIPFVWLVFAWKRRFKAYDHAIFVTYSLSFMSLLFIAISLVAVSPMGTSWVLPALAIAAPLHVYKQLKYTYDLSRFSTLWRFAVLFVCMIIVIVIFLQILLAIGGF
ncbi:MAG: DUF3667 domain-containing protein [Pseudomonadota bacterium]